MSTRRITRPSLADLWRQVLATLEGLGVEGAPALARSLAVSGLTGRPSAAMGVRVERTGEDFTITSPEPSRVRCGLQGSKGLRRRSAKRRRGPVPAGC